MTRRGVPLDSLLLRRDIDRVLDGYRAEGFWQARVWFPDLKVTGPQASVHFRIAEGVQTRVGEVQVVGNGHTSTEVLLDVGGCRTGAPLLRRSLERALDAMLGYLENHGFPYCTLSPEVDLRPGRNLADLRIVVDEGPLVVIDTVVVRGNRNTQDHALVREMRLGQGEKYDQRRVNQAVAALRRLPYLDAVEDPRIARDPLTGRTSLVVEVREAASGRVQGAIGYASGEGSERGLTGALTLSLANLGGVGRRAHGAWSRQGPAESTLNLEYLEPWACGYPVSPEASLRVVQRPEHVAWDARVGLNAAPSSGVELSAGLHVESVRPDSMRLDGARSSRGWRVQGGLAYDSRDRRLNSQRGGLHALTFAVGRVAREAPSHSRVLYRADAERFLSAGWGTTAALGLHAAGVHEAGGVAPEALLELGGGSTVRGYRERAFVATDALWATLELRRHIGYRSRIFAFVDGGRLCAPSAAGMRRWLYPLGYGFGMRLDSRSGTVAIDYGLARGQGPGQGMVHLRMAGTF